MAQQLRRVNIMLDEEQYHKVQERGLNLSGFIRDLIGDRFSERHVVLSVSERTRTLYNQAISNFGATDQELEDCLLRSLDDLLKEKALEIERVRKHIKKRR